MQPNVTVHMSGVQARAHLVQLMKPLIVASGVLETTPVLQICAVALSIELGETTFKHLSHFNYFCLICSLNLICNGG